MDKASAAIAKEIHWILVRENLTRQQAINILEYTRNLVDNYSEVMSLV